MKTFHGLIVFILLIIVTTAQNVPLQAAAAEEVVRPDGLRLIKVEPIKEEAETVQHVTVILKTGYVHDPAGKAGLTELTNEMVGLLIDYYTPATVSYFTAAEFSIFQCAVPTRYFKTFSVGLDEIIRLDALMLYDLCNNLVMIHKTAAIDPGQASELAFYQMLYGSGHPYTRHLTPNYQALNISEVNNWFRRLYRPNNLIVVTTKDFPEEFLRKPNGRDMKGLIQTAPLPTPVIENKIDLQFVATRGRLATIYVGIPAPPVQGKECFTAILFEQLLQKELWDSIREKGGYAYDLRVSYSYLEEPGNPNIKIVLETLPEDAGTVIAKILSTIQQIKLEGATVAKINPLMDKERKILELGNQSNRQLATFKALAVLFNTEWVADPEAYLNGLASVTSDDLKHFLATQSSLIKVAVSGPVTANNTLKNAVFANNGNTNR